MATANQTPAAKSTARTRRKPGPKPKVASPVDQDAAPVAKQARFKHELRSTVTIAASKEAGTVRARAEWATGNVSYFVAYTSKTGEYREAWIDEDLLTPFAERRKRGA